MRGAFRIVLRAGEKIYVNGAVLRVDRKVGIEFLNDVTFLLGNHVMQAEAATTPLRQLYFFIQTMLIDPTSAPGVRRMFDEHYEEILSTFKNMDIRSGLMEVNEFLNSGRHFDALKTIRSLLPLEESILSCALKITNPGTNETIEVETWK